MNPELILVAKILLWPILIWNVLMAAASFDSIRKPPPQHAFVPGAIFFKAGIKRVFYVLIIGCTLFILLP